jgi:ATPase subunit of ABC transporter with duplicated ATPase domains
LATSIRTTVACPRRYGPRSGFENRARRDFGQDHHGQYGRQEGDLLNKKAAKLSSGERAKVILAAIILVDNNLLVLDEPTNYLDIETQDVLLEALEDFPGGMMFVSHDRHFVERLATETLTLEIT